MALTLVGTLGTRIERRGPFCTRTSRDCIGSLGGWGLGREADPDPGRTVDNTSAFGVIGGKPGSPPLRVVGPQPPKSSPHDPLVVRLSTRIDCCRPIGMRQSKCHWA